MNSIVYKAGSRGHANYGWLNTWYSFSFAEYYNPERVQFGALRVLNDDTIAGGEGFGMHPHKNMEIVTIMLEGELEHKDSMGHTSVLKPNEVQVMTAGTGIYHAEFNHLPDVDLKLLQIWVLPEKQNLEPRYDQQYFDPQLRLNSWQTLVTPKSDSGLWVNQQTWFSLLNMQQGHTNSYQLHNTSSGVFVFIIEGSASIEGQKLEKRDAIGIWEAQEIKLNSENGAEILLIEVPMK